MNASSIFFQVGYIIKVILISIMFYNSSYKVHIVGYADTENINKKLYKECGIMNGDNNGRVRFFSDNVQVIKDTNSYSKYNRNDH